jgi:hypothetical protein
MAVFQPDIQPETELTSDDLKRIFKGQEEGGMRYSKTTKSLLLVTDRKKFSGTSIYGDEWVDGILHYRGTGQRGDQSLDFAGNKRLMRARQEGTAVHVVERTGRGRYRYLSRADLVDEPYRRNELDADGKTRMVWVFPVALTDTAAERVMAADIVLSQQEEVRKPLRLLPEEAAADRPVLPRDPGLTHDEIQLLLLQMGAGLGLDVWVAANDRGKTVNGQAFSSLLRLRASLPSQFDPSLMRIIQNIDVLWLRGNGIEAAFEIEHTTSVYSGLLRMSDLVTLHPNFHIRLYVVAPDIRESKVLQEIVRPTFEGLPRPLHEFCGCITYSRLLLEVEAVKKYGSQLKPGFLKDIARFADPSETSASSA